MPKILFYASASILSLSLTACVSTTQNADYQYSHSKPYSGFDANSMENNSTTKRSTITPSSTNKNTPSPRAR